MSKANAKARATEAPEQRKTPSFLFDLDGTLVDADLLEHIAEMGIEPE